ncbi:MAG: hypothetical protein EOO41_05335, partial [Methanobacteriota archaeon]
MIANAAVAASASVDVCSAAPVQLSQEQAQEMVQADVRFKKYADMKKMGIPLPAVKGKMVMDGMSEHDVAVFLTSAAPASMLAAMGLTTVAARTNSGSGSTCGNSATASSLPPRALPPTTATLKLHWEPLKLSQEKLQRSVWGQLAAASAGNATGSATGALAPGGPQSTRRVSLETDDVQLLTSLFASRPTINIPTAVVDAELSSGRAAGSGDTPAGGVERAAGASCSATAAVGTPTPLRTLLDFKRANNLNIALAQFRRFATHADLFTAVYRLDTSLLPRALADNLAGCMPTTEEQALLSAFTGDESTLMECDRFVRTAARIPRMERKVAALLTVQSFDEVMADVRGRTLALTATCDAVLH